MGMTGGQLLNQDDYAKDPGKGFIGSSQWLIGNAMKPNDLLGIANTRPELFGEQLRSYLQMATRHLAVMTFCGDRHWQYHSIHPLGVEEFSCGALNDENAIGGVKPGNPQSTDPRGLIQQPFLYPRATGGFLHVAISEDTQLAITHHDDEGTVMNRVHKQAE
jgi:hypothetical protein